MFVGSRTSANTVELAALCHHHNPRTLHIQNADELSVEDFNPEQYQDEYRQRVLEVVNQKAAGQEITIVEAGREPAEVVDLMEALKASLAKGATREKKPSIKARRAETVFPSRKANALKK